MKYKAIIFDAADTLIDHRPNFAEIYGDKVRSLGLEVTEKDRREMHKAVYKAVGEKTLKVLNGSPRETSEESDMIRNRAALSCVNYNIDMTEIYLQLMAQIPKIKQEIYVISGVFETLDFLKKKYRLAIVSNYAAFLADRLKELGLYQYFDSVVISDIVGIEKPDTRIMDIALNELNLLPSECLYVGDHPLDVLCSKKAGMDCAWISGDWDKLYESIPFKEDYRIRNITVLMDLL